ncbi:bifunctional 5,10-methylenetetrahydrofolate dehydrogenase/5,10-methenyltetrahydrofolate cyclohydrolase [Candidatus Saccharibacteria bacterium]|nr:bifunctional 5,10-methylenetetrahydrofolate dehydrogenase/5,10-methenyltetrahydrofolate cyclohydrolase [Candidatus Saccharibacteria bacterium]
MKELNGKELSLFIKERQAKAVRGLRQANNIAPKLAIIRTNPDPVVDSYMRIKQSYGEDILIDVDVYSIDQNEAIRIIESLNNDDSVHGIIVQIPLPNPEDTNKILNAVSVDKDVDGLAENSKFDAPTPMAINWLLAGYGVELAGKQIVVVGHGRLVGRPLTDMWQKSGYEVIVADKNTVDLGALTKTADILVCATGVASLIKPEMVKDNTIIIDAGVSTDSNGLVGDVSSDVRKNDTLIITPQKGGVGPLTVAALFENVITAARSSVAK